MFLMLRIVFLLPLLLFACAQQPASTVNILSESPLQFSGKGAGAGMMLSSAMGPMGIAIGFAIDEGIAKDIRATALKGNVVVEEILQKELKKKPSIVSNKAITSINIDRHGFITWPGGDDLVMSQFHITINDNEKNSLIIKFPEDFSSSEAFLDEAETLSDIKQDSDKIRALLTYAVSATLDRLIANPQ